MEGGRWLLRPSPPSVVLFLVYMQNCVLPFPGHEHVVSASLFLLRNGARDRF